MEISSINVRIKTEQLRNDQIFECEVELMSSGMKDQGSQPRQSIKEIVSKYKIALAVINMQIESGIVVGVAETLRKDKKKNNICVLSA